MSPTPARTRHHLLRALGAVTLLTACALGPGSPASAAPHSVTVDLADTSGPVTGVGSGFLYGLTEDGSGPGDDLLAPLEPTSGRGGGARLDGGGWAGDGYTSGPGYQRRITSALAQARRLTTAPHDGTYDLLVSDVWGADTTQAPDTVYPCAGGDCGNWESFLRRLARDVRASGLDVRLDVWNEPAGAFFPPGFNTEQYYGMWDTAVRVLREELPGMPLVGPSLWDYSAGNLGPFLDHAKAAGTVPDILNWHFSQDPVADAASARGLLAARGLDGVALGMNEYLHADEQHAGHQAWYLARLAASGIPSASHAIWDDCCAAGTLDGVLVRDGSGALRRTGQWWVYEAYAKLDGVYAGTVADGPFDAVAAVDAGARSAGVLLGAPSGGAADTDLTLRGLAGLGGVTVTVRRIPDTAPLDAPVTVSTTDVPAGTDSVTLPLRPESGQDAFSVSVTG